MSLRHIVRSAQFNRREIEKFISLAQKIKRNPVDYSRRLNNKILANMFYEPSTRTSSSFQAAMMRLGGNVIQFNPTVSSAKKGETLLDTIKMMEQYTDLTVIRHPESKVLDPIIDDLKNPVINAGDGANEHPTQGLLDLLTITEELKLEHLDNLNITMVGDLKYGRTVHSLTKYLLNFDNIHFNLVSPSSLKMPDKVKKLINQSNSTFEEFEQYDEPIQNTDVLYMTRIQQERFDSLEEYNRVANSYHLKLDDIPPYSFNSNFIVLHPLPRVNEIDVEVDDHPSAKYFDQAGYGMYMRMALILHSLDQD